jgi:phage internal scaffolding protein
MPEIKNIFSPSERVVSPEGRQPAQQQFKDDCDINSIMRRFQKTGAIDHVAQHQPKYGIASPLDLHAAMNLVTMAESMFADLPSSLRRRFNGNATELLDFVQNPENAAEAQELGLALSDAAQIEADKLAAARQEAEQTVDAAQERGEGGGAPPE